MQVALVDLRLRPDRAYNTCKFLCKQRICQWVNGRNMKSTQQMRTHIVAGSQIQTTTEQTTVPNNKPIRHIVCAAHWVGSKPIRACTCRVMQLKLDKPTMAIGHWLLTGHVRTTCQLDQSRSK